MHSAPFIGWVDYSPTERDRMRQALALFKENDTRDELGLGSIRDALADLMFPGTSTIQTRLRYFLFVPWIYQELDRPKITQDMLEDRVRRRELDLIEPLKRNAPYADGIFGKQSGHHLERLPSSVYWNGLRTWGLFRYDLSQDQLRRSWDHLRARRKALLAPDDTGIAAEDTALWDHQMPAPAGDWVNDATLDLTHAEACYLQARMQLGRCAGSLLAHWACAEARPDLDADFPWSSASQLPPALTELLQVAERFSLVMHGAALLYNLALARKSQHAGHQDRIAGYEEALAEWAAHGPLLVEWQPSDLWRLLANRHLAVVERRSDRRFVEAWVRLIRDLGPDALADSVQARQLIERRELELKKARSRFHNARALDRWSGSSGAGRLEFRWGRVRVLLRDLYAGLDLPSDGGPHALP